MGIDPPQNKLKVHNDIYYSIIYKNKKLKMAISLAFGEVLTHSRHMLNDGQGDWKSNVKYFM